MRQGGGGGEGEREGGMRQGGGETEDEHEDAVENSNTLPASILLSPISLLHTSFNNPPSLLSSLLSLPPSLPHSFPSPSTKEIQLDQGQPLLGASICQQVVKKTMEPDTDIHH